jgi:putative heme iron utilization protein
MEQTARQILVDLVRRHRMATLGTLREGAPSVSLVPFAADAEGAAVYLLISRLANHTRDLLADPRAALLVAEPDAGAHDPQGLARLSLRGRVRFLDDGEPDHSAARATYLGRFPTAEMLMQLGDFLLARFEPSGARFIAGFGRIYDLTPAHLAELVAEPG